jgi:hypothetical protein
MMLRRTIAVLLTLLTACGGTLRATRPDLDPSEAELAAARYELRILTPGTASKPVEVDEKELQNAVSQLARAARLSGPPREAAWRLFEVEREVEFLVQVEDGRVVQMLPLGEGHPLSSHTEEALTREYERWCAQSRGGNDCLGLLVDGPSVRGEDRYALALAIALGSVLNETQHAVREMADPRAVLQMVLWAAVAYLMLWALPEPVVSKGVAVVLTVALLAWLTADAVWSLMKGWVRLVEEANRATTFEQLREAGERYGQVLGQNTARVLVLLVTAALGGSAAKLAEKLPLLPGFARAAVHAEAQGGPRLVMATEVESVAVSPEGFISLMVRGRGGRGGMVPPGSRPPGTAFIRHQGGNRQVVLNGQRWHLPATKSLRDIPVADPVGNQLQAAATRAARSWSSNNLSAAERNAIQEALARGEQWRARLLERQARGRFVEDALKKRFQRLQWNHKGVDAIDPATGYRYELLSGTESNLALHGQRMADVFFRMITF